ncbi:MAG: glycosyltransferase family 39 protein [Kofleriaceae bacterium]
MLDVAEMPRSLRGWLLGSIAIAFLYLLVHAHEPLRLNVGDPGADANVLTSIDHVKSAGFLATSFAAIHDIGPLTADSYRDLRDPPLSEIFYGAVGKFLGVSEIGTFRLFGLMFSALAMWLLFSYVRRLYADRVALIATALFSTSLLWMMYADSIHQAPVLQCAGFLALWGLVRALETRQRRHYAAALVGSLACFFTSYDYCLFLPAAVLFTVYLKAGHPFARGYRHLVALCAVGFLLGILARYLCVIGVLGWDELVATWAYERGSWSAMPTMVRRITLVFTPFVWITVVFHVVKALRAPDLTAALKDTAVWMLLAALALFYLFAQRATSQMVAAQALLPFYAIGSARLLDRLLDGRLPFRRFALVWLAAAPLWSFYFMFTHPRSVLRREDVAKTNAYLAAHDHNDFVLSNLVFDGLIGAAFQRHRWAALDTNDPSGAPRAMLRFFERTGAADVHEVIFTGPDSRFVDQSLWPLAAPRDQWAITGAPHMHRAKTNGVIAEDDRRVMQNLKAVKATKVLQLSNYAVYRVDRAAVLAILGKDVPAASHIDFGSINAWQHELLGWSGPILLRDGTSASGVERTDRCAVESCKTVLTSRGLGVKDEATPRLGLLMIRVERVCDLRLTFTFAGPSYAQLSIDGFATGPLIGNPMTFTVPARHLTKGVNVVELENMFPSVSGALLRVTALDLAPACAGVD